MYQNYLFDLYGTLIDIRTDETSRNFFKKYAKWLRSRGYAFEWKLFYQLYSSIERRQRAAAAEEGRYLCPEIAIEPVFRMALAAKGYRASDETVARLCENFRRLSTVWMRLYPDARPCLEALRKAGRKVYLLSNAQRSYTWPELEATDLLAYFDGVLISSNEGCMKPDPAFFDICCERYGLEKKQCVMIGNDLQSDMAGAWAAGIDGFWINRGAVYRPQENAYYRYVSDQGSLMEVLSQTGVAWRED